MNKIYISTTIDTIHQQKMQTFHKQEKQLPKMKRRVKEITLLLNEFDNDNKSISSIEVKKSRRGRKKKIVEADIEKTEVKHTGIQTYDEYYTLLDEKTQLIKKINKVENKEEITDYFLENGELVFQYYDQKQNPNFMKKKRTSDNAKKKMKKNTILYYLMKNKRKNKDEENVETEKTEETKKTETEETKKTETEETKKTETEETEKTETEETEKKETEETKKTEEIEKTEETKKTIEEQSGVVVENKNHSIIKNYDGVYKGMLKYVGKNDVIDKYMRRMDPNYQVPLEYDDYIDYCEECKCYMTVIHSEGVMRCEKCGYQEDILIDSDKPSYKDPPRELSFYSYKKMNHLSESLFYCYKQTYMFGCPFDIHSKLINVSFFILKILNHILI